MANKERITCDYSGCTKPYAYMVGPFNLCSHHLWSDEEAKTYKSWLGQWIKNRRESVAVHGS